MIADPPLADLAPADKRAIVDSIDRAIADAYRLFAADPGRTSHVARIDDHLYVALVRKPDDDLDDGFVVDALPDLYPTPVHAAFAVTMARRCDRTDAHALGDCPKYSGGSS